MSRTHAGLAFGIGGLSGIVAAITGGSVVGRGSRTMMELGGRLTSTPEGPERAALSQQIEAARRRTGTGARAVLAFVSLALVLMTLAHYI